MSDFSIDHSGSHCPPARSRYSDVDLFPACTPSGIYPVQRSGEPPSLGLSPATSLTEKVRQASVFISFRVWSSPWAARTASSPVEEIASRLLGRRVGVLWALIFPLFQPDFYTCEIFVSWLRQCLAAAGNSFSKVKCGGHLQYAQTLHPGILASPWRSPCTFLLVRRHSRWWCSTMDPAAILEDYGRYLPVFTPLPVVHVDLDIDRGPPEM